MIKSNPRKLYLIIPIHGGRGFPSGSNGKEFAYNPGDLGSTPGSGRVPGGGHSNPY